MSVTFPKKIESGMFPKGHVQGIAVDQTRGYVYYSFTTSLVKTDLQGKLIGTVEGLTGHLGCIDINKENGKVYGSLEYKNDAIGQGIFKGLLGREGAPLTNAFYIAIFDVERITSIGMDAERDGIMRAVYLPDVTEDFDAKGIGGDHRYACSGCDGTAFGPVFGADADSPYMLMLAYGIYSDTEREDNDHQIILQYDWRQFESYAKPLTQEQPHQSGPRADARYFAFTGNTNWGVQNLYYDREHAQWMLFVYRGKKPQYPNYGLYLVDATKAAERKPLAGLNGEVGALLTLKTLGNVHEESGICGFDIDLGQFGVHGLGDNLFYLARPTKQTTPFKAQGATLELYRYTGKAPAGFELL